MEHISERTIMGRAKKKGPPKKSKSFTLTEVAIAKLEKQDRQAQYVEIAIRGAAKKQKIPPSLPRVLGKKKKKVLTLEMDVVEILEALPYSISRFLEWLLAPKSLELRKEKDRTILDYCAQAGLTASELVQRMGRPEFSCMRQIKGEGQISSELIFRYAQHLGVEPDVLFRTCAEQLTTSEAGEEVRAARVAHGLTQKALAGLSGIKQSNISRIERGSLKLTWQRAQAIAPHVGREPLSFFLSQKE